MKGFRVFKLLATRLPHRFEFHLTVSISLLFVLVAFTESCLHFYGADVGELPSPAHAWAWNMNLMQVNSMRVYLFFFMPVLAALVFAGNAHDDIKRGVAGCVASRSSFKSYFVSNLALSYLGGFLLVFATLALLQALAFVAFPLDGTFHGYLDTPVYLDLLSTDGLMKDLQGSAPYLYNLVFALWASAWSGACALVSFGISFFLSKHKTVPLVIPTLVSLCCFQLAPYVSKGISQHLHFGYCYPNMAYQDSSLIFFVAFLVIFTLTAIVAACLPLTKGRDMLL